MHKIIKKDWRSIPRDLLEILVNCWLCTTLDYTNLNMKKEAIEEANDFYLDKQTLPRNFTELSKPH
jgi:hypothetical protein